MLNSTLTGIIVFIIGLAGFALAFLHIISFDAAVTIASLLGLGTASVAHTQAVKLSKKI